MMFACMISESIKAIVYKNVHIQERSDVDTSMKMDSEEVPCGRKKLTAEFDKTEKDSSVSPATDDAGDEADFDDILSYVGQFGRYQKKVYWLLCLPAAYAAIVTLSFTFTGAIPKHRCRIDQCDTVFQPSFKQFFVDWTVPRKTFGSEDHQEGVGETEYQECRRYRRLPDESLNSTYLTPGFCPDLYFSSNSTEECSDGWVFDDSAYQTTIVTEYQLVCDRARWQSFVSGAYMAGMLVGSYLMGYISDRIGRKPAFFLSLGITVTSGMAATFAPSVLVFLVIRFITGAGNVAVFQTTFVLAMEYVGPDYRMACGIWIEFFFAGGEILVGILAYFIRDWKPLQLIYHGIGLLFISYYWLVPESARWQMARGRNAEARETLTTIGDINGKPVPKSMLPSDHRHAKLAPKNKDSADETMLDLLKVPRLRLQFFNVGYAWFVNVLVYYGLGMTSTSLGGHVHLTYILTMFIEFPAYWLCLLLLNRFGRRLPFSILLMTGGVACLLTGFFPQGWYIAKMCMSLLGKLCISATFAIAFIYTGELYPTVVRNAGIGAASTCARMGGILAPFIADLGNIHSSLPYLVFGCAALLAGVLSLDLPDTLGVKLPETVEEAAEFAKGKGIFTCWMSKDSKDAEVEANSSDAKLMANGDQVPEEGESIGKNG